MKRVRLTQGILSLLVPMPGFVRLASQVKAVAYSHGHLPDVGEDFCKHDAVARFCRAVDLPRLPDEVVAYLHFLALLGLLAQPRMRLTQIPDVKPGGRHAVCALDLDTFPGVLQALLRFVQRGVAPRKVPVHDVMELPALLRLERNKLLDLLQRHEGVVSSELLHSNGAQLVQGLDQPCSSALPCQRDHPRQHLVSLVNLIILEVHTY
mmetsp:Transcript_59097/g.106208  ORF Transcript_59097/g.106208 Transcript_59097/m.106208 type:complete len:208 (-) Transcript_59097:1268-1891(-)